ncbi:hypothetical protein J2847_002765 [Azospirillum agricola]|nr:hypothetical protein [Azospirillum agricola]
MTPIHRRKLRLRILFAKDRVPVADDQHRKIPGAPVSRREGAPDGFARGSASHELMQILAGRGLRRLEGAIRAPPSAIRQRSRNDRLRPELRLRPFVQ